MNTEREMKMSNKFASTLTSSQIAEAREFEAAGITTYSQAVKAFERKEWNNIQTWREMLRQSEID